MGAYSGACWFLGRVWFLSRGIGFTAECRMKRRLGVTEQASISSGDRTELLASPLSRASSIDGLVRPSHPPRRDNSGASLAELWRPPPVHLGALTTRGMECCHGIPGASTILPTPPGAGRPAGLPCWFPCWMLCRFIQFTHGGHAGAGSMSRLRWAWACK